MRTHSWVVGAAAVLFAGGCEQGGATLPDDEGEGTTGGAVETGSASSMAPTGGTNPGTSSTEPSTDSSSSSTSSTTTDDETGTGTTTGSKTDPEGWCFFTQGPLEDGDAQGAVYLFDNDLEPTLLMPSADEIVPAPTGDKFAYLEGDSVLVYEFSSGRTTDVTAGVEGPFFGIQWASDGSALSFVNPSPLPTRAHAVRADGTGHVVVADFTLGGERRWSETGATFGVIDVGAAGDENAKLVVADLIADTRTEVDAMPGVDECVQFGYAPCGDGFIAVIGDCVDPDVHVVEPDGTSTAVTADGLGALGQSNCAPEAGMAVIRRDFALWATPMDGSGAPTQITGSEGSNFNVQLVEVEGKGGEPRALAVYEAFSDTALWVAPVEPSQKSPTMPTELIPPSVPYDYAWQAAKSFVALADEQELHKAYVTNPQTGERILVYEGTDPLLLAHLAYRSTDLGGEISLAFSLMFFLTRDATGEDGDRLLAVKGDDDPTDKAPALLGDGETQPLDCTPGPFEFMPCLTDTKGQPGVAIVTWDYEADGAPIDPEIDSATFSGTGPLEIWPCEPLR